MNLAEQLLERITDSTLTFSERARLHVQLSKTLEDSGNYEGAREAMGALWSRVGERPVLDGLDQKATAEVLLQAGVLTSCIGSARQVEGAQETAKNLISESIALFEALRDAEKVAEAQTDLAYCYWRQGEFDEARIVLRGVLSQLSASAGEVKAVALIRSAIVERGANRLNDALRVYIDAAPFFEKISNHALKGNFHVGYALVLKNLGLAEGREDYIDRALLEFTAASFHFEKAGHERFHARVENNLAMLFSKVGRFAEAHEHVERARKIFARLKDNGSAAQVNDTRARVLLAEGRNEEAEKAAHSAVRALEKGDEQALLAEALTTHGVALARAGRHVRARLTLQNAILVAERAGDLEGAGQAALTVIEELSAHLAPGELVAMYERANESLAKTQHQGVISRLLSCSVSLMKVLLAQSQFAGQVRPEKFGLPPTWEGFSFKREMRCYERFLIERALKDAGGVISRAAQLLGFNHHQSLGDLLTKRHRGLRHAPIVPRKRSIIRDPDKLLPRTADTQARPVRVLHVEDNALVAGTVKETLKLEGWSVESCADGTTALKKITGDTHYDLLLLDYDLPGVNGLELARRARRLSHRRRTPIIMLSASDVETEAWRAGVDAFLHKPGDVLVVAETVTRLLTVESAERL